jgi:hypothetical protein
VGKIRRESRGNHHGKLDRVDLAGSRRRSRSLRKGPFLDQWTVKGERGWSQIYEKEQR